MGTTHRIAALAAAALLIAALPAAAGAAARKVTIRPTAFSPSMTHQADTRSGAFNSGPGVFFWAPLKLPLGSKITGISYRRIGHAGRQTNAGVHRVQPGKVPAWQEVYHAISTAEAFGGGIVVNGTFVGATKKVGQGWDYFVLTYVETDAAVGDVTVRYVTP